jgi:hypothetical protein
MAARRRGSQIDPFAISDGDQTPEEFAVFESSPCILKPSFEFSSSAFSLFVEGFWKEDGSKTYLILGLR